MYTAIGHEVDDKNRPCTTLVAAAPQARACPSAPAHVASLPELRMDGSVCVIRPHKLIAAPIQSGGSRRLQRVEERPYVVAEQFGVLAEEAVVGVWIDPQVGVGKSVG